MKDQRTTSRRAALAGLWLGLAGSTQVAGQDSIISLPDALEDRPYNHVFDPRAYGHDGNVRLVSLRPDAPQGWLQLGPQGRLTGTPQNAHVGLGIFVLEGVIPDGDNGRDRPVSFTLEITVANTNDAPQALPGDPIRIDVTEDAQHQAEVQFSDYFSDVDADDAHTLHITTRPGWLDWGRSPNGTFWMRGTPGNRDVGGTLLTLVATDSAGATATQNFDVVVTNVNDAPHALMSDPIPLNLTEGGLHEAEVRFEDYFADDDLDDSHVMTIVEDTRPEWMTVSQLTHGRLWVSGTPRAEHVGSTRVTLRVEDSGGASATQDFAVVVASADNADDAP